MALPSPERGRVRLAVIVAALSFGLACATQPPEVKAVREGFDRMAADRRVQKLAGVEIHDAELAVQQCEQMWHQNGNYDESVHLAYIATRRIELAWLAAERRELDDEVEKFPQQMVSALLGDSDRVAASMDKGAARIRLEPQGREGLERVLARLDASPKERGVVTLGDVLFGFDSATLRDGIEPQLDLLAEFVVTHPERSILVEGHTDDTGVLEYNFDLSRRRAESIKAKLVEDGVEPSRVLTVGYGPVYPVATNGTPTGRARNRRVEVVVLARGEQIDAR